MSSLTCARKHPIFLSFGLILATLLLLQPTPCAHADPTQASASVNLQYFAIQVQYPNVVLPGETVNVDVQAVAKSSAILNSLTAYVYYVDGPNLDQLSSATVVGSQNIVSGNSFASTLPVNVPQGMPRTSLFATFTESVKQSYVSSYSYQSYYGSDYYCGSYNYRSYYYNGVNACYPYYSDYNSYPEYSYVTTSDTGISPLSYVNATTPEYTALQTQYQNQQQNLNHVQYQNQNLQQQVTNQSQEISQLQGQVKQLEQNLQSQQNDLSQKDSANSYLSSQLTGANSMNHTLTYLALGFGAVAIMGVLLGVRGGPRQAGGRKTQSVNPYAANYVPPQTERPETV